MQGSWFVFEGYPRRVIIFINPVLVDALIGTAVSIFDLWFSETIKLKCRRYSVTGCDSTSSGLCVCLSCVTNGFPLVC